MKLNSGSVRYGAIILSIGNMVSQLLGFLYRMLLARFIGAEGMGLFQLIFPFYSLSMSLATSGLCVAVARLSAEYLALGNYNGLRALIRRATAFFFIIFAAISAFALLFSQGIAANFLGDERTQLSVYVMIPVIFFTGIENIHKHFLYGTKSVTRPAISDFIEQLLRMGAVALLLWVILPAEDGFMLAAIVCGMLVAELFSSAFMRLTYRQRIKRLPPQGEVDINLSSRILKTALPVSLTQLANNLLSSLIVVLLPRRLVLSGITHAQALGEIGVLFGMAMPLLSLPSALIAGLGIVMVPKLSENLALGNYVDLRHKVSRALTATTFLTLPALAILVPLGEPLGWLMFNQRLNPAQLPALAVGVAFIILMSITGSILNGLGKQTVSAMNFLIGNAVELAIVYICAAQPSIGINGYIAGLVISAILTFVLNLRQVLRYCKLRGEWRRWFVNPMCAALLAGLCARLIYLHGGDVLSQPAAVVVAVVGALAIYLAAAGFQGVSFSSFLRANEG